MMVDGGSLEWPLSRNEKKERVLQLFDRDLQKANELLSETEKQRTLLQCEVFRLRRSGRYSSGCASEEVAAGQREVNPEPNDEIGHRSSLQSPPLSNEVIVIPSESSDDEPERVPVECRSDSEPETVGYQHSSKKGSGKSTLIRTKSEGILASKNLSQTAMDVAHGGPRAPRWRRSLGSEKSGNVSRHRSSSERFLENGAEEVHDSQSRCSRHADTHETESRRRSNSEHTMEDVVDLASGAHQTRRLRNSRGSSENDSRRGSNTETQSGRSDSENRTPGESNSRDQFTVYRESSSSVKTRSLQTQSSELRSRRRRQRPDARNALPQRESSGSSRPPADLQHRQGYATPQNCQTRAPRTPRPKASAAPRDPASTAGSEKHRGQVAESANCGRATDFSARLAAARLRRALSKEELDEQ